MPLAKYNNMVKANSRRIDRSAVQLHAFLKLMTKDQYLGFQRGPRPEQSDQRQPDQAASFSHKAEALRNSASVASRIRFPTGTVTGSRCRISQRAVARALARPLSARRLDCLSSLRSSQ